ncbi:hypothetical protein HBH98_176760 [Parastagonospora nodorum]|nr:hypothetical protein HBH53_042480 [Parastagonospora nodorum]KAH4047421.1 hypothetical protein HBH49_173870 [Parastagonospora nodorum]KAH4076011.1 hypothetical protein HBH50_024570 [Parastagonospora nodorum]KAH4097683.1 hypothetical protein HBH48_022710 [Parastagonospora nodorum]KAH4208925.1 hypothetical protein HBI95_083140 [Parastagonospora nodorum]
MALIWIPSITYHHQSHQPAPRHSHHDRLADPSHKRLDILPVSSSSFWYMMLCCSSYVRCTSP